MSGDNALVSVEDLSVEVRATGRRVVDGISFEVAPGEQLGIIGESGSGKSVTSLAMLGLLPAGLRASGSIRVDGQEVVGAADRELRRLRGGTIAMVFQDPSTALDPLCRVGRFVGEQLRRHRGLTGDSLRQGVRHAFEEVALPISDRVLDAYPHELSGGQRQRVAIAAALACGPRILLADEPTTALDVTVQAGVLDLMRQLARSHGMALVLVSHDLAVVAQTVTRGLVMHDGRIVEQGTLTQLIAAPREPYTRRLVESARALDRALTTGELETGEPR